MSQRYMRFVKIRIAEVIIPDIALIITEYVAPLNPTDYDIGRCGLYELFNKVKDLQACLEGSASCGDTRTVDIHQMNSVYWISAVREAVKYRHVPFIEYILNCYSKGTTKSFIFTHVVRSICMLGYDDLLEHYHQLANTRYLDSWEESINFGIRYSSGAGHFDISDKLISWGALPKYDFIGSCRYGNVERAKNLMIDIDDKFWAARVAIEEGCLEIAKDLYQPYVEENKHTMLGITAERGHLHIVKWLVENGADPRGCIPIIVHYNMIYTSSITRMKEASLPSQVHAVNNHRAVIDYLLQHGDDVNAGVKNAITCNNIGMIKYLIDRGGDIDLALNTAQAIGNIGIIKLLNQLKNE